MLFMHGSWERHISGISDDNKECQVDVVQYDHNLDIGIVHQDLAQCRHLALNRVQHRLCGLAHIHFLEPLVPFHLRQA